MDAARAGEQFVWSVLKSEGLALTQSEHIQVQARALLREHTHTHTHLPMRAGTPLRIV